MSIVGSRLNNEVMMLDNYTCVYCGKQAPEMTIDHLIARSAGGTDTVSNLVACCQSCNSRKGPRPLYETGMFPQYGRFAYVRDAIAATLPKPDSNLKALVRQMQRDGHDATAIGAILYQELSKSDSLEAARAAALFLQGFSPAEITRELRGVTSSQGGTYQRALNEVLDLIRDGVAVR